METITNTGSPEQTQLLGEKIGHALLPGDVIALYGDLGSGKTTFVQGVLKGSGIKDFATSPSFVIVSQYNIPSVTFKAQEKKISLYHVDMYRLESEADIENLGIEELLRPDSIVVVEWAEKVEKILPSSCVKIYFEMVSETERKITVVK